ncbi:uncharacterized protein LOC124855307 [Girardinichthys multiradiatus]|uniref:uncharacterized protein LOC124855307 n=1 Tax=Girardinichthys multiradiatus TaxID=208333 RepID=UPI001FAE228F|nr:uncharacterized protein LOC124855307 [Girardinichthys multiradiatus]
MIPIRHRFLTLLLSVLWIKGLTNGSDVTQTPLLWMFQGQSATMSCSHTKDATYFQMYWYQQLPGQNMKLIVFTTSSPPHQYEKGFSEEKFPAEKKNAQTGSLTVEKLQPEDSGVYFCAQVSPCRDKEDDKDIMIRNLSRIILLLLCFSYLSQSKEVNQDPPAILGSPQSPATINCSHSISGYYVILWYQKRIGDSALKLIGYIANTSPTLEDQFKNNFSVSGDGSKKSQLHVQKLQPEDSSIYYCAASRHSDSVSVSLLQKPSLVIQHMNTH